MILKTPKKTSEPQAAPRASDRSLQVDDDILSPTPYSEEEIRALEEGVLPSYNEPDPHLHRLLEELRSILKLRFLSHDSSNQKSKGDL